MVTKSEEIKSILIRLRKIPGVQGSMLITRDGIPVVADLSRPGDHPTFSAMTAAMLGAAETAVLELGHAVPEQILVDNRDYRLQVVGITPDILLVIQTKPQSPTDPILTQASAVLSEIRKAIVT